MIKVALAKHLGKRIGFLIVSLLLSSTAAAINDSLLQSSVTIFTDAGSGSGVVVDSTGVIFTNHHVIEDAEAVAVRLNNGDVFTRVDLLAVDKARDIAILKVGGFDLKAASLGNSNSVEIGDAVNVVGAPRGLSGTITTGIVSARRRMDGVELIQIDAAISPGSSGGAVFNTEGQVIALAVSQFADSQNLNFAIPINYARGLSTTGAALSTFKSGGNVMLSVAKPIDDPTVTSVSAMTKTDVIEVAEIALGVDFVGPGEDGFYLAERGQGEGSVWLYFNEDVAEFTMFWGLSSVQLDQELLTDLLRVNFLSSRINVGLYDATDGALSMGIGFESKLEWLEPKELAAAITELVEVDGEVYQLVTSKIPDEEFNGFLDSSSRPSFDRSKRNSNARRYEVMNDEFSVQIPKAWKMVSDSTLSNDGRRREFEVRGDNSRIILLEEYGEQRVRDDLVAMASSRLAKNEGGDAGTYLELAKGVRNIGDNRVIWVSVVHQRPGNLPVFYEFNAFIDVTNLMTLVVVGEELERIRDLGTEIIRSLR